MIISFRTQTQFPPALGKNNVKIYGMTRSVVVAKLLEHWVMIISVIAQIELTLSPGINKGEKSMVATRPGMVANFLEYLTYGSNYKSLDQAALVTSS